VKKEKKGKGKERKVKKEKKMNGKDVEGSCLNFFKNLSDIFLM